ncbi:conserved oligomeric Golgi complex subunit 2 [Eurosta solidaginis]|uniref:conserved oligomeric Golgi complex subunit 2 n=1 Tax=Eurosta solidaginis TaxID=178769 RepID=UPI00353072C0
MIISENLDGLTIMEGSKSSTSLCFDKNDFMKVNFSVDEFLHKNRNAPSLEQLRDDLGLYLKDLRASMIDLINADYADFVSLSANLVGLDQSIASIENPLMLFRKEVETIRSLVSEAACDLRNNLERKQQLRELKRNLQCYQKVMETMNKLKSLLQHQLKDELKPTDLERSALELLQLQFNQQFCLEILNDEQKKNCERLQINVLKKQRLFFNEALINCTSTSSELLERCLQIYITLNACDIAEQVFREDVVAPYMSVHISEHCLQNSPQGLSGIYGKILNFISLKMTDLLRLTHYTDKLKGFNFLVNSFWADVEMRLETYMSSIFAPGNSDVFYAKYKCTRDFLTKIEDLLAGPEAVKYFRTHKQTISFHSRWNLPVYFQICFQEIAGDFETTLEPLLKSDTIKSKVLNEPFQLATFNSANKAIERCWAEGVYLKEIFPKFFKLNLQILLRLIRWISDVINLNPNAKTKWPSHMQMPTLLIALYADIRNLVQKLPQIQEKIKENVPKEKQSLSTSTVNDAIDKSLTDVKDKLDNFLVIIQDKQVDILIGESCLENIRQVKDLPRLYRKTNREVPTKASAYVEQMLRPLKVFQKAQTPTLGENNVIDILLRVSSKITKEYYVDVMDVLTSVQKTEESLRRLRNLKSGTANSLTASTTTTMSDDDKIRLQLHVDVIAWTGELTKLGLMPTDIDNLPELNNMVETISKIRESNDTE